MVKVILNTPTTTDRYGLHFVKGEAFTDNEHIINRLQRKGVTIQAVSEESINVKVDMNNIVTKN